MNKIKTPFLVVIALFVGLFVGRIDFSNTVQADLESTPSWKMESNIAGDVFGYPTGQAGDVNGDGHIDFFVSSNLHDNGNTDEGLVEVFYGSVEGISETVDWSAESNQDSTYFGYSVDFGDFNGDSYDDLVIGSHKWDEGGDSDIGKAWVYFGSSSGLSTTADWTVTGETAGDKFGVSVGNAGDVDDDGYDDILVGAQHVDNGSTDEGKVYLYYGSSTGPGTTADWTFEPDAHDKYLGTSVRSAGDVNNDGYDDFIVGGQGKGQYAYGSAYVFYGSSTGPGSSADRSYTGENWASKFGFAVSSAGDINDDGYDDVIIGSPGYKINFDNYGKVYAYYGSSSGLGTSADWTYYDATQGGSFGLSVSSAGDMNHDGYADIIVSEPDHSNTYNKAGRVFVFTGSSSGMNNTPYWTDEGTSNNERLGMWVSDAGSILGGTISRIVIGTPDYDNGQTNEGQVEMYYAQCD